uniref:Uncharacterized protein n=1 Tax=Oryza sativa subsp. japonica TaxID=39947 RepID=Q6H5P0_ORYSJ|nr:hypothetical protein [Oryza sativa Japonica Group]
MAAAGMGGDGNSVPTTPDHNGAAAEGRQDLGKILERLGREEPARSDQKRRPTAAIRSGAHLDFGKAAPVGFWTEWSGSQGAVERGDAARRRLERREAAAGGGIVEAARVDSGGGILVGDWGKEVGEKRRLEPAVAAERGGARGCGASKVERGNGAVDGVRTAAAVPGRATAQCGVNGSGGAARLEFAEERRSWGSRGESGKRRRGLGEEGEMGEEAPGMLFIGEGRRDRAREGWKPAGDERESRGRGGDVGGFGGHGGGWGWS